MFLPKPAFTRQHHVGVVVTDMAARLVHVDKQNRVLFFQEVLFPHPILSPSGADVELLGNGLQKLVSQSALNHPYVAVCLPEKYVFSREYTLPKIDLAEVDEAVSWQLESIFPFPKAEIYSDWKLLSTTDKDLNLLVASINRSLLDTLKTAFETAGLSPISFEPSASVLTRLMKPPLPPAVIIIEIDNQGTIATLVIHGVSSITATTIIQSSTPPTTVMQDILTNLEHLKSRVPTGTPQTALMVTGDKASTPLVQLLGEKSELPATLLEVSGIPPAYHTAYAAAISTVLPPISEQSLNLLPSSLQAYYQASARHQTFLSTVKFVSVMTICALVIAAAGLTLTLIRNSTLNHEIKTLPASQPQPAGQVDVNEAYPQAQRFLLLYKAKTSPEYTLSEVFKALGPGISLTDFIYDAPKKTITLSAIAQTRADVLALKENLDATNQFSKIVLPLSTLENISNYPFTLTFTITNSEVVP